MKEQKTNRTQWLHLRLTTEEYKQIQTQFKRTTNKKMSVYARHVLLGKPLIAGYRNQSLTDITAELFKLRKDLNGIANNFNQAVHKLHTLERIPEFKEWIFTYEKDKGELLRDIQIIKTFINRTSEEWLQ